MTDSLLQQAPDLMTDPRRSIKATLGRPRTANPGQRLWGMKHLKGP